MTYRAAYLAPAQSVVVVMTLPEHAGLSDEALIAEAVAEGRRSGLVSGDTDDEDGLTVTEATFRDQLVIGDWND